MAVEFILVGASVIFIEGGPFMFTSSITAWKKNSRPKGECPIKEREREGWE